MKPAPLGSIESLAMESCMAGRLRLDMPRSLDLLCDDGLIDEQGVPTEKGRATWRAYLEWKHDLACRNHVLPSLRPEALEALARLVDGEEIDSTGWAALRRHEGLACRRMDGTVSLADMARRAVRLAREDGLLSA